MVLLQANIMSTGRSRLALGPILDQAFARHRRVPFGLVLQVVPGGLTLKPQNFCFTFLQEALLVHRWIMIPFIAFLLLVWIPIGFAWCLVGACLAVLRRRVRYYLVYRH